MEKIIIISKQLRLKIEGEISKEVYVAHAIENQLEGEISKEVLAY